MNKLLVLAAFLGYALAGPFDFWTEGTPTTMGYYKHKNLVTNEWFTSSTFTEADFGFGTFYQGGYSAGPTTRTQQYGAHFYSYARQSVTFEALKNYMYVVDIQVEPVYIAPYIQSISWTEPRPDEGTYSAHFGFAGDRVIEALAYNTYAGENGKVFEKSLLDVIQGDTDEIMPKKTDFGYNGDEYYHDW